MGPGICENFLAALRGWPIREIERSVRLSETQRVAFYELVSSSLKAADTLASACPAENALTPLGRLTQMRARFLAVRQATTGRSTRAHTVLRGFGPGTKGPVCGNALRGTSRVIAAAAYRSKLACSWLHVGSGVKP